MHCLRGSRLSEIWRAWAMNFRVMLSGLVLKLSAGRIVTRTARRVLRERKAKWMKKCEQMQIALDEERARGWGFRYIDGRRVDWR